MMNNVVQLPTAQPRKWYSIQARANRGAEIVIYDDIGGGFFSEGVTARQFAKDLKAIGTVERLDVRMNSYGGVVDEGLAIYRTLIEHPARVTVHVDGVAASIASAIAMAGDEIVMAESSTMMLHEAWGGKLGTAAALEAFAKYISMNNDLLAKVYADRTGNTVEKIKGWMSAGPENLGTWMDAQTALDRGFATKIVQNAKLAASARITPAQAAARMKARMDVLHRALHDAGDQPAPGAPIDGSGRAEYDALVARVKTQGALLAANRIRQQIS
jgi:ATP-dependent protease ClpP protease subunit